MKVLKRILIILISFLFLRENIVINLSPSMRRGIYLKEKVETIKKGDIVIFPIPVKVKDMIYERGYLSKSIKTLLKRVAATSKDSMYINSNNLYINEDFIRKIRKKDSRKRDLPQINLEVIKKDEVYLLGDANNSFDSIYFGPIKREDILYKAKMILPFEKDKRLNLREIIDEGVIR